MYTKKRLGFATPGTFHLLIDLFENIIISGVSFSIL